MLSVRNLTIDDMHHVRQCVTAFDTMYSVPIDHDEIIHRVEWYINEQYAVGCFDGTECVGICTQFFWPRMPIWSASNLFIRHNSSSFLSNNKLEIMGTLMSGMIANGEKDGRYEFYYVTRDSTKASKKQKSYRHIEKTVTDVAQRYDYIDLHILKAGVPLRWDYVKDIIGKIGVIAINPPFNKTLIVRKAVLKSQYYPR